MKAISVLVLVCFVHLIIGCGYDQIPAGSAGIEDDAISSNMQSAGNGEIEDWQDVGISDATDYRGYWSTPTYFDTNNELPLCITEVSNWDGAFHILYEYPDPERGIETGIIEIDNSLMRMSVISDEGEALITYDMSYTQSMETVTITYSAGDDTLSITHYKDQARKIYYRNGISLDVAFNTIDDAERAFWLYSTFDENTITQQPEEDQSLYFTIAEADNFLTPDGELFENSDGEILGSLIENPEFWDWLIGDTPLMPIEPATSKICAAAGIVSTLTCWCFMTGWCAILCVPATGFGLACGVATLAGAKM